MMEVIRSNGGLDKVSDSVLRQLNLVRLYDPTRKVSAVYSSAEYGRLVAKSLGLMRSYRGYIFAHDLNRIYGMIARHHTITETEIDSAYARAKAFIRAGIPPIFDERYYNKATFAYYVRLRKTNGTMEVCYQSLFPSIDFILQYGTGSYERNCAYMAVTHKGDGERSKIPLKSARIEDVRRFRSIAFTEDKKIEPLLIRDITDYVNRRFDIPNEEREQEIAELNLATFQFLEEQLRDLPHQPRSYELWNQDVEVVHERRWYLRYHPSERELIAQAYLQSLAGSPTQRDLRTFNYLSALFPEQCAVMRRHLGVKDRLNEYLSINAVVNEAAKTGNLSLVPQHVLVEEPWRSSFLPRYKDLFRSACRKLGDENPGDLLRNVEDLYAKLNIPPRIALLPELKAVLDEERLRAVQAMPDNDFIGMYCGANSNRRNAIGLTRGDRPNEAGKRLQGYIVGRAQELSPNRRPSKPPRDTSSSD